MNKKNLFAAGFTLFSCIALFFKMPGVSDFFGLKSCASCGEDMPYLAMFGSAYFAFLTVILLSIPRFPGKLGARCGLLWAIGLGSTLTYLSPKLCAICISAHTSHIIAWAILLTKKEAVLQPVHVQRAPFGLTLSCALTASVSVMALFSTLNFTFALHGMKGIPIKAPLIQVGKNVTPITFTNQFGQNISDKDFSKNKAVVVDFVSNTCPYCKEQLQALKDKHADYQAKGVHFIAVSRDEAKDLRPISPNIDWVEDSDSKHFTSFGVSRYPTVVILDPQGTVVQTISGLPSDYKEKLTQGLDTLVEKSEQTHLS